MIFCEIDGLLVAVDSACNTPPNLTEILDFLHIVIDNIFLPILQNNIIYWQNKRNNCIS